MYIVAFFLPPSLASTPLYNVAISRSRHGHQPPLAHGWGIRGWGHKAVGAQRLTGGQAGHGGAMAAAMEYTVEGVEKAALMFGGRM